MAESTFSTIILDVGTRTTRAGLSGQDGPSVSITSEVFTKDRQRSPVENGLVTNWDLMVSPAEHPVFTTETPGTPKYNRERTTQIMFETFTVPAFFIAQQPVLGLLGEGSTTGISLHIGEGGSYALPVYEGFGQNFALQAVDVGGRSVTQHLIQLLSKGEHAKYFESGWARERARHTYKEKGCYVALDPDSEKAEKIQFPVDGQHEQGPFIQLENERFQCCEVLFNPSLLGLHRPGIHELVQNAIMKLDQERNVYNYQNIVLSGSTSGIPGMKERLRQLIENLQWNYSSVKIFGGEHSGVVGGAANAVWKGAEILASSPEFEKRAITMEEYNEFGPTLVHRKCFL